MTTGITVAATGPALAFLLFENSNSSNNQAGFLLGDVVSEKKKVISDYDYGEEKTETIIHVHSVIQVESLSSLYSIKDRDFFKNMDATVVGWYSFKRNVVAVPTLKDRYVHKQLLEQFRGNAENFVFCLLTSSENGENMSHSFKQNYLVLNPSTRKYEAIPLLIENLANVSPQYRAPLPPTGEELLQNLIDPTWTSDTLVNNLQMRLAEELSTSVSLLVDTEREMSKMEQQLSRLQEERNQLRRMITQRGLRKARMGDEGENVSREIEREGKERKTIEEQGREFGDSNLNRYQQPQPTNNLRGVLGCPPPAKLRAEAKPFNPRFPNCDGYPPHFN